MCKIKSGSNIQNEEDVKNLIVGILLRQQKTYSMERICGLVQKYLQGSTVQLTSNAITLQIEKALDVLSRNGDVKCEQGLCYVGEVL